MYEEDTVLHVCLCSHSRQVEAQSSPLLCGCGGVEPGEQPVGGRQ